MAQVANETTSTVQLFDVIEITGKELMEAITSGLIANGVDFPAGFSLDADDGIKLLDGAGNIMAQREELSGFYSMKFTITT